MSVQMRVKRMNDLAKIPFRGSESAAGYDLYAATSYNIEVKPHTTVKVGTGLMMEIPEGYYGHITSRSGVATKRGLRMCQGCGTIDSDYRGEIILPIHNDTDEPQIIEAGERLAQLILLPYLAVHFEEVKELDETERGDGGFGHTGEK